MRVLSECPFCGAKRLQLKQNFWQHYIECLYDEDKKQSRIEKAVAPSISQELLKHLKENLSPKKEDD